MPPVLAASLMRTSSPANQAALLPCGLVLLLIVAESLLKAAQHLGCGFEHRLQLRLVDFSMSSRR